MDIAFHLIENFDLMENFELAGGGFRFDDGRCSCQLPALPHQSTEDLDAHCAMHLAAAY